MNLAAIRHRSTGSDCYALDSDTVVLNLWTDYSVKAVSVVSEDPFIHELHRRRAWDGKPTPMRRLYELAHQVVWTAELKPAYKRLQYYFVVEGEGERLGVFENKICPMEERDRISTEYFKFPWINPSDVIAPPDWVREGDFSDPHFGDLYGGNLRGIRERLPYLRQLGVSGIYLTPIFLSNSNHKYNTFDYYKVDPDFGSEQDLRALVQNAHALGMRIMLDAVFNHCGTEFFADDFSVADGRFYTFSFWAGMPKLNTNNPEVQRYFADLCVHWVGDLGIDGIRFDVGDEISHSFLRRVNAAVKAAKPETFLLGEIWFDAIGWLGGCEYDSVMNYPFTGAVGDFWRDREMTARDFMHRLNFCRSLYPRQINEALFSFLDTHDTARVRESCRNQNEMLQKLAILLTMAGTPCLYYGTEIAMKGAHTPYNRSTMPWDEIDAGKFDRFKSKVSALVRVRSEQPDLRRDEMDFFFDESLPRLVGYRKGAVTVLLNAGDTPAPVAAAQEILFSNGYKNGTLLPDGVLLCK